MILNEITETDNQQDTARYRDAMGPVARRFKRLMDVAVALGGMLLFSPLYVLVYCAIKIERTGPALFRQERIGYKSKPFTLYKFRTMHVRAEADGTPQLYIRKDKRLTRVGRFLREHHLDELPQLWNILKGDMSLVGPRPERKFFIDKIMLENPDYEYLYQLRPGVFSKATLYNGYTDTMEKMLERLRMDLEYLTTRSIGMDVKIIVLTVMSIIIGKKF